MFTLWAVVFVFPNTHTHIHSLAKFEIEGLVAFLGECHDSK